MSSAGDFRTERGQRDGGSGAVAGGGRRTVAAGHRGDVDAIPRLSGEYRRHRPGRGKARRRRAPRPADPGRHAARLRRPRGDAPDPRGRCRRRRGVPVRAGHPGGQGRRAHRRRRRLRDQAVRPGGAGRPRRRGAAPDPAVVPTSTAGCWWPTWSGAGDLRGRAGGRVSTWRRPSTSCCATCDQRQRRAVPVAAAGRGRGTDFYGVDGGRHLHLLPAAQDRHPRTDPAALHPPRLRQRARRRPASAGVR